MTEVASSGSPQPAAGHGCLGRQRKLLTNAQFSAVFDHRKSIHGKYFSIHVAGNALDHPRLGLAVSRRVSKKAVQRNRIKRQIRESFRLRLVELPTIDLVVVAKAGGAEQANQALRRELDKLWYRAAERCAKDAPKNASEKCENYWLR
ncbi:ribonuclease P protein component [Candidatus Spongiihabitans sp.]|uniref:ribonuclease P protein component n=1 Tax=Candidatus Spongiihabitans sp. TaxID=3101308 RepID=UPI003C7D2263